MFCCHHQHFTALFLLPQNQPLPTPLILYIYLCTKYYAINTLTRHSHSLSTHAIFPHIFAVHYERVNSQGLGARGKWWGYTPARPHARNNTPEHARKTPPTPANYPQNDRLTDRTRPNPRKRPKNQENAPKTPHRPNPRARMR